MNPIAKPARTLVVPFLASALLGLLVGATVLIKAVPAPANTVHTDAANTPPSKSVTAKKDKAVLRLH